MVSGLWFARVARALLVTLVGLFSPTLSATDSLYSQFQTLVDRDKYYEDSSWLKVLFARRLPSGHASTLIDDSSFLLSQQRPEDFDPRVEMLADVRALVDPSNSGHFRCQFPRRYKYLSQKLGELRRVEGPCSPQINGIEAKEYTKLYLVYIDTAPENAASLFGHSFLLARKSKGNVPEPLQLAIGFGTPPRAQAWHEVFGDWPGHLSLTWMADKLQEYSDIESRNLWEYPLALNPHQVEDLILSAQELEHFSITYRWMGKNCSHLVMALLASTTDLPMSQSRLGLPSDTIKILSEQSLLANESPESRLILESVVSEVNPERDYLGPLGSSLGFSLPMSGEQTFLVKMRPALHSLIEPAWGYNPTQQIEILQLELRIQKALIDIQSINLFSIYDIGPRWGWNWAWGTELAFRHFTLDSGHIVSSSYYSWKRGFSYIFSRGGVAILGNLQPNYISSADIYLGPEVIIYFDFSRNLRLSYQGSYLQSLIRPSNSSIYFHRARWEYSVNRSTTLSLGVDKELESNVLGSIGGQINF